MKLSNLILYSAGAFVAVAAIGALTSPKLTAALRAAYVEMVVPGQPYHCLLFLETQDLVSFGPGTGTLGVTNITLNNPDSSAHEVAVIQTTGGSPGSCAIASKGITQELKGGLAYHVLTVQPHSTLVMPLPTPWVLYSVAGQTCIGAQASDNSALAAVSVDVTGFVN